VRAGAAPGASPSIDQRILDAADLLFYGQGIQAVGVDAIATEAGISKRTLYKHFPSKDQLVAAYLERRTMQRPKADGDPLEQILAVFDRLERWFATKEFRGCPFVNAVSELSGNRRHPAVVIASEFKAQRRQWFEERLREVRARRPNALADQLVILVEGAIAASLVRGGDPGVARSAAAAARVLLAAAGVKVAAQR